MNSRSRRVSYHEGDLFAVPLASGGFGVMLVARHAETHLGPGVDYIFVYGFNRTYERCPELEQVSSLTIFDAVHVNYCVDASIRNRRWKRLGALPGFQREDWPVPPCSQPEFGKKPEGGFGFFNTLPRDASEQRVIVAEDRYLNDANLPNNGFIDPGEYQLLPRSIGLGLQTTLEIKLDRAIRERHPVDYIEITPLALKVWRDTIERVKAAGLYPEAKPWRKPRQRTSKAASRSKPAADNIQFWPVIEKARRNGGATAKSFVKALRAELAKYNRREIVAFQRELVRSLEVANTWDLRGAAHLMNDGCSDDGFLYFRAWLIAQGEHIYKKATHRPETLASARLRYGKPGTFELEELLDVSEEALHSIGDDNHKLPTIAPKKPRGRRWSVESEENLKLRLPRLWRRYRGD